MLKAAIRAVLPESLRPHQLARARVIRRSGGRVIAGPFAGQVYITSDDDLIEPSMLMGVYEKELHPAIERVLANPPELFVDVGAAQGYYSVGFARRAPQSRHVAFEMSESGVAQLKRTIAANRLTDRIELRGECSPAILEATLQLARTALVLMDVDGPETTLLNPIVVPSLRSTAIIVETHDHVVPGVTSDLQRRFSATHSIEILRTERRTARDLPFLICDPWTLKQLSEGRNQDQKWLLMLPRT